MLSAKRDLDENDLYWAVVKVYQSVFFILNALLIKEFGFFSKDHKCLLTGLLKKSLVDKNVSSKILKVFDVRKNVEEMDIIRQERNITLYHPKSKGIITRKDAEKIFKAGREILNFVLEVLG